MKTESSVCTQVAVSLIPRLNDRRCLPLIERCGGIEGFFMENEKALDKICQELHVTPGIFDRHEALQKAEYELEQIDKQDIRICSVENPMYPSLLKNCEDAPIVFFYKGNIQSRKKTKYLAIVGTRHASARCKEWVSNIISELCRMGHEPVIISGLAYGIDSAAHRASLKNGLRTFAVLGHGLHMIYPASHKTLANSILDAEGAWISEFPCSAPVQPFNFLKRNRIIAGLSHATLIAESAIKGGAMSTARLALAYNRDVMAFPGRKEDTYSAGCNLLIKENIAALTENSEDIARILGYPDNKKIPQQITLDLFEPDDQANILLCLLKEKGDMHIDEIHQFLQILPGELSALLLQLELESKIWALPGKRYALK